MSVTIYTSQNLKTRNDVKVFQNNKQKMKTLRDEVIGMKSTATDERWTCIVDDDTKQKF